jgi:hypothetical protein
MKEAIRSEWLKLRTTRTAKGLLAGVLALTALASWGTLHETGPGAAGSVAGLPLFLVASWGVAVLTLVLGIRSVTDEVRHGSLVPTLLATPDRRRVVSAKLAIVAGTGAVFGLAAVVLGTVFAVAWTAAEGATLVLGGSALAVLALKVAAIGAAWASIGLGVGFVVRHQVAAIAGALVYMFVVEDLVAVIARGAERFLPGAASEGLLGMSAGGAVIVGPVLGAILLAGYAALALGLGTQRFVHGDVT